MNNCSTLFELIRAYRTKHKIELECEYHAVSQAHPNYLTLPTRETIRAFDFGLMLARSMDSPRWLERRINFTASLAMTSIAGYVLGLGEAFC
jgi:FKBP12-rapamycin complex-associated protein